MFLAMAYEVTTDFRSFLNLLRGKEANTQIKHPENSASAVKNQSYRQFDTAKVLLLVVFQLYGFICPAIANFHL